MHKKQPSSQSNKEDHENKLIIEKWMKRNSSNKLVIGQNVVKLNSLERKPNNTLKCDIKVSEEKKVVIPVGISENNLNKLTNIKRVHSLPSNDEHNATKAKVLRQSLPHKGASVSTFTTNVSTNSISRIPKLLNKTKPNIEIIPTKATSKNLPCPTKSPNKTIPIVEVIKTTNNIIGNEVNNSSTPIIKHNVGKSISITKGNQKPKNSSTPINMKCNITEMSPAAIDNQTVKHLSPPTVKCNVVKTSTTKVDTTSSENNVGAENNEVNDLFKKKEEDVYICLLENYRYLVIPKEWSVNEYTNERKKRYIVFFNTQVIEEKGILISVIKKSLIIDKGGTMNYSVHGLPIDIRGTILPKTLDNIKKLLSILHIFDKMQVCEGLGFDLNVVQNSVIIQDCYRHWRHKNCKVILIKATRCPECTEVRNALKKRSEPWPNIVKPEIEFVDVSVKTEGTFDISEEI